MMSRRDITKTKFSLVRCVFFTTSFINGYETLRLRLQPCYQPLTSLFGEAQEDARLRCKKEHDIEWVDSLGVRGGHGLHEYCFIQ